MWLLPNVMTQIRVRKCGQGVLWETVAAPGAADAGMQGNDVKARVQLNSAGGNENAFKLICENSRVAAKAVAERLDAR